MDNYNTAAEVDMWDRLVNIEDFNKEMVEKRAKKLARDAQKSIIEQNAYLSAQAVVATSVGYDMLSDASAALDELSVTGDRVDYQTPTLLAKIGRTGANLFCPVIFRRKSTKTQVLACTPTPPTSTCPACRFSTPPAWARA
jgi:hypothetical protein